MTSDLASAAIRIVNKRDRLISMLGDEAWELDETRAPDKLIWHAGYLRALKDVAMLLGIGETRQ